MTVEIGTAEKLFILSEAQALLPLIWSITDDYAARLLPLQNRLNRMLSNDPRRSSLEQEYELIVRQWQGKVQKLGIRVAGLWRVHFDVGEGYLIWHYPDKNINFWQAKQSHGRQRLSAYVNDIKPDWAI